MDEQQPENVRIELGDEWDGTISYGTSVTSPVHDSRGADHFSYDVGAVSWTMPASRIDQLIEVVELCERTSALFDGTNPFSTGTLQALLDVREDLLATGLVRPGTSGVLYDVALSDERPR